MAELRPWPLLVESFCMGQNHNVVQDRIGAGTLADWGSHDYGDVLIEDAIFNK